MREAAEIDDAFARRAQRVDALIVGSHFFFGTHHTRVITLAAQHRVPTMYPFRHFVETGGLMSYGINIADLSPPAATYVDKILKGATPADLPVEQPLTFELVINLQTAQALGLTLPPSLLFQADAVLR